MEKKEVAMNETGAAKYDDIQFLVNHKAANAIKSLFLLGLLHTAPALLDTRIGIEWM